MRHQILDDYEKARLCDELTKILMNHCGEDGDNEGAVETLNRISKKARIHDKWLDKNNSDYNGMFESVTQENKQLRKLRELVEKRIKENEPFKDDDDSGGLYYEFKNLLEESKK